MPTHGYPWLVVLHLLGAVAFAGTVFFEVVILEGVRRRLPVRAAALLEGGVGTRARRVVPWVLLVLYGSGLTMAWHHRGALAHPLDSSFGLLMAIKVALAASVLGHVLFAMALGRSLSGRASRILHLSVFVHVLAIVVLAKAMFFVHW
ncbi:MAG TPA: hypothetical protein VFM73_04115 [Xanthomonadaceae bacterium]|nr:hypothetical protein [Xanthomonadaceae bacterium]